MIVQSCTFTIHFPRNDNIRRHLFELEEHFCDFQKPFTLVPVPPEAPLDIPRIVAITPHFHSQLLFTATSVQVTTSFDEEYNRDISKCLEYVRSKCENVVSSLRIIDSDARGYYSGVQISLLFDAEDGISDPIAYLSNNYLKLKTNLNKDEIQFRTALVAEDKYYINIALQNFREFAKEPDERGSLVESRIRRSCVQAVLDINDRYAFNHIQGYYSSAESVKGVINLAEKISAESIQRLIKDGEFNYGSN